MAALLARFMQTYVPVLQSGCMKYEAHQKFCWYAQAFDIVTCENDLSG
jgi:hypothetical protein